METEPFEADREPYPTIRFLLRYGAAISIVVGLLPVLGSIWLLWTGLPYAVLPAGLVLGLIVYFFVRSYTEIVAVIADTLLPK